MYTYSSKVSKRKFYKHIDKIAKLIKEGKNMSDGRTLLVKKKVYNHKIKRSEEVEYLNLPVSFDIETSSFYYKGDKIACMYINQFGLDGKCIYFRTWEEFINLINLLVVKFELNHNRRIICYVHNLSFEMGFFQNHFDWEDVFAREKHAPFKAITKNGVEFRCSYMLSGLGLEKTCESLVKYKVTKKVGDLDYNLIRTPITPMNKKEINYCLYDIIGVMNYIEEQIEQYGDITKIPLTNTGKVRKYCREVCFSKENAKNYRSLMSKLTITAGEYRFLFGPEILSDGTKIPGAFGGGYCHANYLRAGDLEENVFSQDFSSSYPSCCLSDKFPMSTGEWIKITDIKEIENMAIYRDDYYVVFEVEFKGIKRKEYVSDTPISVSKCWGCKNVKIDNGRVLSADKLITKISSDDWWYISRFYDIEEVTVGRAIRYFLDYLPRPLLQCILDFYKKKTELKDTWVGKSPEEAASIMAFYQLNKGNCNSIYGCMCSHAEFTDEIHFENGQWFETPVDIYKVVDKLNKDKKRWLFMPWACRITSLARKHLFSGIWEMSNVNHPEWGPDGLYQDTDSIKYVHPERHEKYFEKYNRMITEKIAECCKARNLNFEDTRPKTIKGEEKPLGVWDSEAVNLPEEEWYKDRYGNTIKSVAYKNFKTLGSKRYCYTTYDKKLKKWVFKITVAGLNKYKGAEYIANNPEGISPFDFFDDNLEIDEDHSGRLTHTYSPEGEGPFYFKIKDYLGKEYEGKELSYVHMEKSKYSLALAPVYAALLEMREVDIL